MKKYSLRPHSSLGAFLAVSLLGSGLIAAPGCGGSGGPETSVSTPAAQESGRAFFTVHWPTPSASRLIPSAANSVVISVTKTDGTALSQQIMSRPSGGGITTASFTALPVGGLLVKVSAYPNADGTGVAQASAAGIVVIEGGKTTPLSLTLDSAIDRLEVAPSPLALTVGQTAVLVVMAKNLAGEIVLTDSGKITFASDNSGVAAVDIAGKVTAGSAAATATVTVTETESAKTATVPVTVATPTPTPTPAPTPTSVSLSVSPKGNIWLSGMPDGSKVDSDVAPAESPSQVLGLNIAQGGYLVFSATGAVNNNNGTPSLQENYPDGGYSDGNFEFDVRLNGAQNGIADVRAPVNALVGVFIDDSRPDNMLAPAALDFTNNLSYIQLSPMLNQPFFIGDGLTGVNTNTGQAQQVKIPAGATRLFIGSMDPYGYFNNGGGFTVKVTYHPL